jgi:hypothetical protein
VFLSTTWLQWTVWSERTAAGAPIPASSTSPAVGVA